MSIWVTALPQVFTGRAEEEQQPVRKYMPGAPEIYLSKAIDNTRVVRVMDKGQRREMVLFTFVMSVLFVLVMMYLWQHFAAIEYGYKIEALRNKRDKVTDVYRTLKLEEATLEDPERIDALAKGMGLQTPQVGQVQRLDSTPDGATTAMAQMSGISVVSVPD